MNEYKITYTGEGEGYQLVVERTEAAAKKFFLSMNKGIKLDITSIELYRENAIATKQQERDTLAAIRKMVEELGPQSYLATAFDGCFEDAENNIENDFADSMKTRWLHADAQLNAANGTIEELKEQLEESKKDWEAAHAAAHAIAEEKDAEIAALRERIIPADDLTDCKQMAENLVLELRQKVKAAEATILEYAEHPETTTFCDAVRERKNLTKDIDYYEALVERLTAAEGLAGKE